MTIDKVLELLGKVLKSSNVSGLKYQTVMLIMKVKMTEHENAADIGPSVLQQLQNLPNR